MRVQWQTIRDFLADAGDIGPYADEFEPLDPSGQTLQVSGPSEEMLADASGFWRAGFEKNPTWLHIYSVGRVIQYLGFYAGRRLGLDRMASLHFACWLALVVSGRYEDHANELPVAELDQIAGKAVWGSEDSVSRAYLSWTFWQNYREGARAVVEALRHGFLAAGSRSSDPVS